MTARTPPKRALSAVATVATALALTLALTACTQTAALAPVGGNRISTVRYAGLDVLVAQKVDLAVAPACTQTGRSVACTGSTTDGQTVTLTSDASDEDHIEVVVGSQTLYSGSITAEIADSIRPSS